MRSGVKVWTVTTICTVVSAIAAAIYIFEFWQRRANSSARLSEPRPAVEGRLPETASRAGEQVEDGDFPASVRASDGPTKTESRKPAFDPADSKVEPLINYRAIPSGSVPVMAIAFDGDSKDVDLLESALAQRVSSPALRLVPGFFKPAFRERGFLRALYDGDTAILVRSGALAAVDRVLVGRVERACRETGQIDSDLVTCDVGLYFKVIDRHGQIANAGHVAVTGVGFSEDAARDRAVELLVQQHGKRVISSE